jgi:WD40-like Beta Propeller Repeat
LPAHKPKMTKKLLLALALTLATAAPAAAQLVSAYYTYFGQNKIVYDRFDWKTYRSTHFTIYFYDRDEAQLQKVASYAESAYDEISRALNFQVPKPINIIYYSTHSEFEQTNTLPYFIPEGVGAFALPTRNRMVLPIDIPDEKLQKLIAHELTHVFQFEILFGGSFIRAYTSGAPQWLTEGMASYFGNDEDAKDQMVLRDAVLADQVPDIAERGIYGFFAYRFGHAVFDFMETEWGKDGVRDFIFEYRGQLGPSIDKVLKRTFGISAEDFDVKFRRFLRHRFIKILTERGEPIDFGDRVRLGEDETAELSVRAFPSGDLGAAISTLGEDANVVLFGARERKLFKNLTKGYKTKYEYIVAQWLTTGPIGGVDLAVSPDGNTLALFVRRERGRELLLLNALDGDIRDMIPMPDLDQQLNPTFSPDGRFIAFRALKAGRSDIYAYSLETKAITSVTNDDAYDFAPVYSPDGQWVYYSSVQGTTAKIFRIKPGVAESREQITYGNWNDEDAALSPDGKRLFFTSDRDGGIYNIYSINLDNGETVLYTNVVGGCFSPSILLSRDGSERLVFAAYYKRRFTLYVTDAKKPFRKLAELNPAASPAGPTTIPPFQPSIEVTLDPEKITKKPSHRLVLEDANVGVGYSSDQQFLSNTYLIFGDNLGDRRFTFVLQSISSFTNIYAQYVDQSRRLSKGVEAFDSRQYFLAVDANGQVQRTRLGYRFTGGDFFGAYPLNRYYRLEGALGYTSRKYDGYPVYGNPDIGVLCGFNITCIASNNSYPTIGATLVGDTVQYESFGPISGRAVQLGAKWSPYVSGTKIPGTSGSTLSLDFSLDYRHYFKILPRTLIAARIYGFHATGSLPDVIAFGGLDTLRNLPIYGIYGNTGGWANFEFRFPLIDLLATPILGFREIRAKIFTDIGGAALKNQPFAFWKNDQLTCAVITPAGGDPIVQASGCTTADYGFGIGVNFLGLPLHFDFSRQWNVKKTFGNYRTFFYIGPEF